MAEFHQIDNKLLDSDDHHDVVIALTPIHYAWFKLGEYLKIPGGTLASISDMYNNNHFRQMSHLISTWISRPTREHHPSWRVLCQALADMGERKLAYKIAGIEEDDQSTNKSVNSACTGGIAVSRIAPTVEDLKEQLHNLTDWEEFAIHLPKIDQHDTTKISRSYHSHGVDRQKLELYTVWLDKCTNASWDHVITALEKNKLHRLVANIKQWLKTKGRKARSESKSPVEIPTKKRRTDHKRIPQANVQTSGLEDTDWDPSPDDDDTTISPITLKVDRDVILEGTVWDSQEDSAIKGRNQQRHLVIVITNEYKFTDGRLIGIKEDRKQLYTAFDDKEMFRLVQLEDTHKKQMEEKLHDIRENLPQPVEYKSVFIIFSGHGCMSEDKKKSFIISDDCNLVSLDDLIHSFEEKIGSAVPKFFLIDACRSVSKDIGKGGPQSVNSLYAYATQKGDVASMGEVHGSYWIQEVVKLLRQEKNIPIKQIINKAEKNISETRKQKPEVIDQLTNEGGSLCLTIG